MLVDGLVCLVACAVLAAPAGAADRVYWANYGGNTISFAELDGSGGGELATTGVTPASPGGVALDPAAGKIYWANYGGNTISFANLDGSGGGGDLNTTGATVNGPLGVALDPAAGKIYWPNFNGSTISFANLDGSGGGGDLNTTPATVNSPYGVALDAGAGRIYWANASVSTISFANLDGSAAGDLTIKGTTPTFPAGVAIDPAEGRIYWANQGANKISKASLDGSLGGDLITNGATPSNPVFPALLERPTGVGAPAITGGSAIGSTLSCSSGSWAPDLLPSFFYRAPQSFAFQWSRNGADIPDASASSYIATAAGDYRCSVIASNQAGSAPQASAPHAVASQASGEAPTAAGAAPVFGTRTLVTLELAASRIPARGPLKVGIANANGFEVTGTLSGETVNLVSVARKRRITLKPEAFRVGAHAKKAVKLSLPKALRRLLKRKHTLKLRLRAKVRDPAGHGRTVKRRVTPKLLKKRRR